MNKDSVPKKLAASFRELVKKSSVEKITIKEIVIHSLEEVLLDYISESASGIPEEIGVTPSRIAGYYANSFYYILDSWIRKGMSYSAQQMADIYHYVSTHSLEDVIHRKEV